MGKNEDRMPIKMDPLNRAKQFMPFDALKGFREALEKKERLTDCKKELPEEWKAELDYKLRGIRGMDIITVEYFFEGEYLLFTGAVSKIDKKRRILRIADKEIPFDAICDLQAEKF